MTEPAAPALTLGAGAMPPAPPPPPPDPVEAFAQRVYRPAEAPLKPTAPTPEIATLRAADTARGLYSDTSMLGPKNVEELALSVAPLATPGEIRKAGTELAATLVDMGMDSNDVQRLASIASELRTKPPSDEQRQAMQSEAIKRLRDVYGNAGEALQDAQRFVKLDPRWAEFLDRSGLGDHPDVIVRMAELARSARNLGRRA